MKKQIDYIKEINKLISDDLFKYQEGNLCDNCPSKLENYIWCFNCEIAQLLYNAGYRKQTEGEWISVEERLPDREGMYLAHTLRGCTVICLYMDYHCNGKPDWERYGVTHWMPLPEPPKMTRKEDDGK